MIALSDPVGLAQALIRCASVTPADDGAQALLAGWLTQAWLLHALAGLLRTDLPPAGWA